jgi:hypothetical protein
MAASPVPVAVTTSDESPVRIEYRIWLSASRAESERENRSANCCAAPLQAGAGHWVSSNRAVTVTVSLSSPASIGVGAGAPAAYAREKAMGIWRPASSVSTISLPILAPPALGVNLSLPPGVDNSKRARLVEQRARIIVAEANAVGAVDLKSLPHLR